MKSIEQWEEQLKHIPTERLKNRLKDEIESIEVLESIYLTGGKLSYFSDTLKAAAYNERQEICQLTSAIYSILRERKEAE